VKQVVVGTNDFGFSAKQFPVRIDLKRFFTNASYDRTTHDCQRLYCLLHYLWKTDHLNINFNSFGGKHL